MKRILLQTTLALVALAGQGTAHSQTAVQAWVQRGGCSYAYAAAADGNGDGFVTGSGYGTIKYSGAGAVLWTHSYNLTGSGDDRATSIAVDANGDVFVTGYSASTNVAPYNYDYATIKYSSAGVALWTNRYNGPGNGRDEASALAVDGGGNVFVTGQSVGTNGYTDYATIKYSNAGVPLWTNRYNGPANGNDLARAVAVDSSGNVVVTGDSYGDYLTIKYSGAGVPLWTNRFSGPGNIYDGASAVAVDGSGNVFVTGAVCGGSSGCDFATIKYSSAGVPLWTNRYRGPGDDDARAIAVDRNGNVFVTGASYRANAAPYYNDYATIKYSGAGVPLWTNRYDAGIGYNRATAQVVDGAGNVIVTGTAEASGSPYYSYYATIKYSGAGVPLWTNRFGGAWDHYDRAFATALAVDRTGNVFVTGHSLSWYYDYDLEENVFYYTAATIKYSVAPLLTIVRTITNTVAISWPSPWTGFTLQQNTNSIGTVNWANVLTTPTDNGGIKTVTVNLPTGNRFYRLKSP